MIPRPKEAELQSYYDGKLNYYSPAGPDLERLMALADAPESGAMLDVGCGDGRASEYATRRGMEYCGIDYSAQRIFKAREKYGHPEEGDRPAFWAADLYDALPSVNPGYELIWCCELLEHLEYPEKIWEEMKRLCLGVVVATCPVNMPYHAHLQVFENEEQLHEKFSDIDRIQRVHCQTLQRNLREHFLFTYVAS